ncbi:MAG: hypothetical protein LBT41_05135 [Candidatus Methanoplasma sp.]|jgi:hypothetical protein|nr:hypothetical protein [Candidatus Methanoplasma sp.]
MIEFTLSRVAVFACGAVLLAAAVVPISESYEGRKDADLAGAADKVALMIDAFWDSEADVMTLRGWDVLPFQDMSVEIDGHVLTMTKSGREYRSLVEHPADRISISYNSIISLKRGDGFLILADQ